MRKNSHHQNSGRTQCEKFHISFAAPIFSVKSVRKIWHQPTQCKPNAKNFTSASHNQSLMRTQCDKFRISFITHSQCELNAKIFAPPILHANSLQKILHQLRTTKFSMPKISHQFRTATIQCEKFRIANSHQPRDMRNVWCQRSLNGQEVSQKSFEFSI